MSEEIEMECPCPESQPTQPCCPTLEQQMRDLSAQLTQVIQTVGHDWRGNEEEYRQYLLYLRRLVIIRDNYYPNYQRDWGGSGGSSVGPLTGTLTLSPTWEQVYETSLDGWWKFAVRVSSQPAQIRVRVTDKIGNTGTSVGSNVGVGANLQSDESLVQWDRSFYGAASPPYSNVIVEMRNSFIGFPSFYEFYMVTR